MDVDKKVSPKGLEMGIYTTAAWSMERQFRGLSSIS